MALADIAQCSSRADCQLRDLDHSPKHRSRSGTFVLGRHEMSAKGFIASILSRIMAVLKLEPLSLGSEKLRRWCAA